MFVCVCERECPSFVAPLRACGVKALSPLCCGQTRDAQAAANATAAAAAAALNGSADNSTASNSELQSVADNSTVTSAAVDAHATVADVNASASDNGTNSSSANQTTEEAFPSPLEVAAAALRQLTEESRQAFKPIIAKLELEALKLRIRQQKVEFYIEVPCQCSASWKESEL